MLNYQEKYVFHKVNEEISTYVRWLENEYSNDPSKDLYMKLQSAYWVSDMFNITYNSSVYRVDIKNCEVGKAIITMKLFKVFMSIRQVSVNGWRSHIVEEIVDDIAYRVFSSYILQ